MVFVTSWKRLGVQTKKLEIIVSQPRMMMGLVFTLRTYIIETVPVPMMRMEITFAMNWKSLDVLQHQLIIMTLRHSQTMAAVNGSEAWFKA